VNIQVYLRLSALSSDEVGKYQVIEWWGIYNIEQLEMDLLGWDRTWIEVIIQNEMDSSSECTSTFTIDEHCLALKKATGGCINEFTETSAYHAKQWSVVL
jgi:hypothetical protein